MCISKEIPKRTPRSPYRRHLSELSKPRLSRHVVKGPRVNLNNHWSKFEELHDMELPLVEVQPVVTAILSFGCDINEMVGFEDLGK